MQLSPVFNIPAFTDSDGNPLAGGKIFAYEAGSFSTLKDTFSTQAGDVANANPIVLDSAGCLPAGVNIWLTPNEAYNLVLTEADGTTVIKSFDNVTGIPAGSSGGGGTLDGVWVIVEGGTFLSPTSFLVTGNQVANFVVGNRARLQLSTGYVYGTVTGSSFSTNTTVTVQLDAGATLNASLDEAAYSLLIQNGKTVDAGAVSFSDLPYNTSGSVGYRIRVQDQEIAAIESLRARGTLVHTASGSGGVFYISPTPAVGTNVTAAIWTVRFTNAGSATNTFNIVGFTAGAKPLKQYDSSGALVDAVVTAGLISDVGWNNAEGCWMLLDTLPGGAAPAAPRGMQVFQSNGTFTTPANVYYLKVTCVGGGGGGGAGDSAYDGGDSGTYTLKNGGGGGGAAASFTYLSTSPGTTYSVSIGAGGTGGNIPAFGSPTSATAGGTTSFGVTLVTAQGGFAGGNASASSSGGSVGAGGVGGGAGNGLVIRGANGTAGGIGGWCPGWGAPGREYGGGGAGGIATDTSGSTGSNGMVGICVVEW